MTTIIATKLALVEILDAALTDVQVTYGDIVDHPRKQRVYLGDVEDHESAPAAMRPGKVRTQEEYTVRVLISVDSNKGQAATETRALEIMAALENALATDPKLSAASTPPGILWATFAGFTLSTSLVAEREYRSLIEADVEVTARNT